MSETQESSMSSGDNIQPNQPASKVAPLMYIQSLSGGSVKVSCPVTENSVRNAPPPLKTTTVQPTNQPIIPTPPLPSFSKKPPVIPASRATSASRNSLSCLRSFLKSRVSGDKTDTTRLVLPSNNSRISSSNLRDLNKDNDPLHDVTDVLVPVTLPSAPLKPNIISIKIAGGQTPSNTAGYTVVCDSAKPVRPILPKQPAEVKKFQSRRDQFATIQPIRSDQSKYSQYAGSHQAQSSKSSLQSILSMKNKNISSYPVQSFPPAVITPIPAQSSLGSQATSLKSGIASRVISKPTGNSNQNNATHPRVSRPISVQLGNKNIVLQPLIKNQVVSIQRSTNETRGSAPFMKTQPKVYTIHREGNRNILSLCPTQSKQVYHINSVTKEHRQFGETSDPGRYTHLQSSANAQMHMFSVNKETTNIIVKEDKSLQPVVGNEVSIQTTEVPVPHGISHLEAGSSLNNMSVVGSTNRNDNCKDESLINITLKKILSGGDISVECTTKESSLLHANKMHDIQGDNIYKSTAESVKLSSFDTMCNEMIACKGISNTTVSSESYIGSSVTDSGIVKKSDDICYIDIEDSSDESKTDQVHSNSTVSLGKDKVETSTSVEPVKFKYSDDILKNAKSLEEKAIAARAAADLESEKRRPFTFNPQDFDPMKVLEWKNGVGLLPGSKLKFRVNEFGLMEMVEDEDYEKLINWGEQRKRKRKEKKEQEVKRKQRRKEPVRSKPNLPSYAVFRKSKHGNCTQPCKDPDEFLHCDCCGCYGMASEFYNSRFCSIKCKAAFRAKKEPERDMFDTGEETPLVGKKRKKRFYHVMQEQMALNSAVMEAVKTTVTVFEKYFLSPEVRLTLRKPNLPSAKCDQEHVKKASSEQQPKVEKPLWMTGKSGFSWTRYLEHCKAKPAPEKLFKDPFPFTRNSFKIGMKMEAIDPRNPKFISVVTVSEVHGYRMELHFDGYSDIYNFWVNADSMDIFPAGWCERNRRQVLPPMGYTTDNFSWSTYLKNCRAQAASRNYFANKFVDAVCPTGFRPGMKFEAHNMRNLRLICVATLADLLDNRLLVHLDGWSDIYDYWADVTSPYIHPVGWCEEHNRKLNPPKGWKNPDSFTWEKYLNLTKATPAPSRAFKQRPACGFHEGMKLEVVDPRVPAFIRVATIADVNGHRIQISFDGWSRDYHFWTDDNSTDIHPVGWCGKTDHILELPPIPEDIKRTKCPILVCCGAGNANDTRLKSHYTSEDCPYSLQNMKKHVPYRLGHRRETQDEFDVEEETDEDIIKSDKVDGPVTRQSRKRHVEDDTDSESAPKKKKQDSSKLSNSLDQLSTPSSSSDGGSRRPDKQDHVFKVPAPLTKRKRKRIKATPKPSHEESPELEFTVRSLISQKLAKLAENEKQKSLMYLSMNTPEEKPKMDTEDTLKVECHSSEEIDPSVKDPEIIAYEIEQAILSPEYDSIEDSKIPPLTPILVDYVTSKLKNPLVVGDPRMWTPYGLSSYVSTIPGCERVAGQIDDQEIDGEDILKLSQDKIVEKFHCSLGPAIKLFTSLKLLMKKVSTD